MDGCVCVEVRFFIKWRKSFRFSCTGYDDFRFREINVSVGAHQSIGVSFKPPLVHCCLDVLEKTVVCWNVNDIQCYPNIGCRGNIGCKGVG